MTVQALAGRKDDTGKDPWDLVPWDAVRAVVKVLAFGAKKYRTIQTFEDTEAINWWSDYLTGVGQASAIRIELDTSRMGAAGDVMSWSYGQKTQSSQSASERTDANGAITTPNVFKNIKCDERPIPLAEAEISTQSATSGSHLSAQAGKNFSPCDSTKSVFVRSASDLSKRSALSMSITVTFPDKSEESCAVEATTVSGCLAKASTFLSERSPTLKCLRSLSFASKETGYTEITITGDRNWEKGMAYSRLYAATMRHMTAWWEGETADPETGFSHLSHAGCCVLFLMAYELRGIGSDDRPGATEFSSEATRNLK
jgi:hypothetical protein